MNEETQEKLKAAIRGYYGSIARKPLSTKCETNISDEVDPAASLIVGYSAAEIAAAPDGANMGLGCGNPHTVAGIGPKETVLDLGAGAGFDCFLAARRVGPEGRVIGVDMTPEMVVRARAIARGVEARNVEFRLGELEHLPLADETIDVILSNFAISLAPDKGAVFREAFRVLRPGGRLAISDVVTTESLPDATLRDISALTGCMAAAANSETLRSVLHEAGFVEVRVQIRPESRRFLAPWAQAFGVGNCVEAAMIEALKPRIDVCVGSFCCVH